MSPERNRDPERVVYRWNRIFTALAAEPRRQVVDALMDVEDGGYVSLPNAADNPCLSDDPTALRVQLHHQHLPLLEASDFVEWQRDPFRAYRGPRFEEVETVLEVLYANAGEIPDKLVHNCRSLERHQNGHNGDSTSMSD